MRGAAATDGSVPVGRRPVQQSRGDLTTNLVFTWLTAYRPGTRAPSYQTSLCSTYLSGAGTPIRTPEYPSITELHTPGRLVLRLLACPLASPDWSSRETSDKILTLEYRKVWQSSCKDKPLNGIPMRDWVNKFLVYQPIATVSYPAMVHRIVLPGIGPS